MRHAHPDSVSIVSGSTAYSASTYKEPTDAGGFFTTSFGRIFCSAKNSGLSGVPVVNPLRGFTTGYKP
jgi:hypothetical protein